MKVEAPLRVQVPAAGEGEPSWLRIGVIAAIGFGIGVGWPRLVGAKLGPSLPAESPAATATAHVESPASPVASAAPPPSAAPALSVPPPPAAMPALNVNHGVLLSCRSDAGETLKGVSACGGLAGFDAIVQPRLRKLGTCPAATSASSGKLSVVFNLDFASKRVGSDIGRSSTVADAQGFGACVKSAFSGVSLGALDHQNPRYTIGYNVTFSPTEPGSPAPSAVSIPPDGVPAVTPTGMPSAKSRGDESSAEVAWDVAIVRDAPRTGSVVARLPRGTKVRLGESQDGWYKVQAGTGPEGWVYRGAVGK